MFVLGITGGIGCGKSSVAKILASYGLEVLDADKISHEVTQAGGSALSDVINFFGPEYISEDGSMDREKMSNLVFSNAKSLDALSLIVHKRVFEEIEIRRNKLKKEKHKAVVLDVPVPAKEGFLDQCDQIWVVWTEDKIRLERLAKRGMNRAEAQRRINIQLSREEYENLADHVIENNDSLEVLEEKVKALAMRELQERGIVLNFDS